MSKVQEKWVDDTENWEPVEILVEDGQLQVITRNTQSGLYVHLYSNGGFHAGIQDLYKITSGGILKRVEEPVFKWTKESVAAVDWSKKSIVETLEACAEHWRERIEHFDVSGEKWWLDTHCPACQKWHKGWLVFAENCSGCPLCGPSCCGNYFFTFKGNKTETNARAVLSYIEQKLEEAREEECGELTKNDIQEIIDNLFTGTGCSGRIIKKLRHMKDSK